MSQSVFLCIFCIFYYSWTQCDITHRLLSVYEWWSVSGVILCVCLSLYQNSNFQQFSTIFFYISVNQSSYPSISLSANLTLFVGLTILFSVFKSVCLNVTQLIYDGKLGHCFVVYILVCLSFYKFEHKPVFLYVCV